MWKFKKDGLLLLIDFEKAFDSVSWSFLYKAFKFFNFSEGIISRLKLFNNDIKVYVSQCGLLSTPVSIQRGCRQGDPIASYVFLVCAEILAIMLKNNSPLKVITIGQHEYLMTQFADDTTILFDGSQNSLTGSLNTLEVFGTISGLKIEYWQNKSNLDRKEEIFKTNLLQNII